MLMHTIHGDMPSAAVDMEPEALMQQAIQEARRGLGRTRPNPMVGCVVAQAGRIIATGYHPKAGQAHAEVVALNSAGAAAKGADVYITLEPCNHQGRTGRCTDALIEAGVGRVFVAMEDPNPLVHGRGIERLRQAGIEVHVGIARQQAERLNEAYSHFIRHNQPWIVAKIAQSLDGKVATRAGVSQWITRESARAYGHQLRHAADGIVVGVGTVLGDDPQLTCRISGGADPVRIVLDTWARTPPTARVVEVADKSEAPTWILVGQQAPQLACERLRHAGANVLVVPADDGRIDLRAACGMFAQKELMSVLVEGGPQVLGSFFDARLVHRLHAFIAPIIIGGRGARSSVEGEGADLLSEALSLTELEVEHCGPDLWVSGQVGASAAELREQD